MTTHPLTDEFRDGVQRLVDICNADEAIELPVDPGGDGLVWRDGDQVVGFASLDGNRVVEATGAVHPIHRRKGIGRSLLDALREQCRLRGSETCDLVIDEMSPSGRAFVVAIGGEYHISEHRMLLDRNIFPGPGAWSESLDLIRANVEELELFATLVATAFDDPPEAALNWLSGDMREPNRRFWIARLHDEPIGTVRVIGFESKIYVTALGILPAYRGRGFGRQVLARTTDMLVHEEWDDILLEVETDNRAALSLYQSVGFQEARTYGFYRIAL